MEAAFLATGSLRHLNRFDRRGAMIYARRKRVQQYNHIARIIGRRARKILLQPKPVAPRTLLDRIRAFLRRLIHRNG